MSTIVTVVSFILVLGVLVFFHELGHYWVARRNKIVVEEFGMGYPPRLVKLFRYDGTDFTLNLVPFGGFARMKGEDASDMAPGSFNAASRGARAATLFAGPLMNALLAVVLFAFSFMAGFPAAAAYPQITDVTPGTPAAEIGLQAGDILLQVGSQPAQVSALPDFRYNVWYSGDEGEPSPTLALSRNGEVIDLPLPAGVNGAELLRTIDYTPILDTQILTATADAPAALAGLLPGDIIYSLNGEVVTLDKPLSEIVSANLGQEVTLTVLRDHQWVNVQVTPRLPEATPEGQGALGVQIGPVRQLGTLPPLQALWRGVRSTVQYFALTLQLPVMLLMGEVAPSDAQLTGPVGIARIVGDAASASLDMGRWFPILQISAVLSAALAITNLLPLPALDGGRLLFILIETLRGRRINPEREGFVHMVGFILLIGLLVFITIQDIRTDGVQIDWAW